MAEKQKPQPAIVKRAATLLNDPSKATDADVRKMAARILDDQKNDPEPHKPSPKKSPPAKSTSKKKK